MDQSKALTNIKEMAELVGMIEDLTNPGRSDSLSAASWAGMRITLRNVREQLLLSHRTLAGGLVARVEKSSQDGQSNNAMPVKRTLRSTIGDYMEQQ